MNIVGIITIVLFCLWVVVVVIGFVLNRLIGSEGRVRVEEMRRERQAKWEQEHPR